MATTNIDAKNVTAGKPKATGAVFRAPAGTALPTDASTSLNIAFKSLGYVSEDGITSSNTKTSEEIKEWGGSVVMTVQTEASAAFEMTFIESLNAEVLKLVFGDANVTESGGALTVSADGTESQPQVFVIEMVVTGGRAMRIVIPNGKISEVGDVEYTAGGAVGYPVTIAALPDTNGKFYYEYVTAAN